MSKAQHGNKEAKKPKKALAPQMPQTPVVLAPTPPVAHAASTKKH